MREEGGRDGEGEREGRRKKLLWSELVGLKDTIPSNAEVTC